LDLATHIDFDIFNNYDEQFEIDLKKIVEKIFCDALK